MQVIKPVLEVYILHNATIKGRGNIVVQIDPKMQERNLRVNKLKKNSTHLFSLLREGCLNVAGFGTETISSPSEDDVAACIY